MVRQNLIGELEFFTLRLDFLLHSFVRLRVGIGRPIVLGKWIVLRIDWPFSRGAVTC